MKPANLVLNPLSTYVFDRSYININAYVCLLVASLNDVSFAAANRPARNTARSSIATVFFVYQSICVMALHYCGKRPHAIISSRMREDQFTFRINDNCKSLVSMTFWCMKYSENFWQKSFEVYSNLFNWSILRSTPSWCIEELNIPLPLIGNKLFHYHWFHSCWILNRLTRFYFVSDDISPCHPEDIFMIHENIRLCITLPRETCVVKS